MKKKSLYWPIAIKCLFYSLYRWGIYGYKRRIRSVIRMLWWINRK
jgi:hypothetical protein